MRLPLLVPVLLLTLFLSGCWHGAGQPPALPTNGTGTGTSTTTTTVDTSDWNTYVNYDYGFSFRYPKEWGYFSYSSATVGKSAVNSREPIVGIRIGKKETKADLMVDVFDTLKAYTNPNETEFGEENFDLISSADPTVKFTPNGDSIIGSEIVIGNYAIQLISIYKTDDNFVKLYEELIGNYTRLYDETLKAEIGGDTVQARLEEIMNEQYRKKREMVSNKLAELNSGIGSPEELQQIALFKAIITSVKPLK